MNIASSTCIYYVINLYQILESRTSYEIHMYNIYVYHIIYTCFACMYMCIHIQCCLFVSNSTRPPMSNVVWPCQKRVSVLETHSLQTHSQKHFSETWDSFSRLLRRNSFSSLHSERLETLCLQTHSQKHFSETRDSFSSLEPHSLCTHSQRLMAHFRQNESGVSEKCPCEWLWKESLLRASRDIHSQKHFSETRDSFSSLETELILFSSFWETRDSFGNSLIDWCCFYYLVRNSLVASLDALCARILSLDSWISVFSDEWVSHSRRHWEWLWPCLKRVLAHAHEWGMSRIWVRHVACRCKSYVTWLRVPNRRCREYVCMYIHVNISYDYTCIYIYIWIHTYMHVCIWIYIYIGIYIHMYIYVNVWICMYKYICIEWCDVAVTSATCFSWICTYICMHRLMSNGSACTPDAVNPADFELSLAM